MRAKRLYDDEGDCWGYTKTVYKLPNSLLLQTSAEFLKTVMENYARFNANFRKQFPWPAFPFLWKELQNQAILLKCMTHCDRLRCFPLPEFRLQYTQHKGGSKRRKTRRLDYWVLLKLKQRHRKDVVVLVEYKHEPLYLQEEKGNVNKDEWREHFSNLNNIKKKYRWDRKIKLRELKARLRRSKRLREDVSLWLLRECEPILVNLMICPVKCTGSDGNTVSGKIISREQFSDWMTDLSHDLRPQPNWTFLWWLSKEEKDDWTENNKEHHEKYFGMYVFACLERVR